MLTIKNNKYNLIILLSICNIYYSIEKYNIFTKCKYIINKYNCGIKKILLYLTLIVLYIAVYGQLIFGLYNFKKEFELLKHDVRDLRHKASNLYRSVALLTNELSDLRNSAHQVELLIDMISSVQAQFAIISQSHNQYEQQSIVDVTPFSGQHFRLSS